jgi:SAM-dependent methyltransferase
MRVFARQSLIAVLVSVLLSVALAARQQTYEPKAYQPGKDVVWVPSPPAMVTLMLDLAKVTPQDFVVDLGSGDGRNIVAAAKRGARGLGVEFNPDMVELSRRLAREAGVDKLATFAQGDMYTADFSQATVLALFLLPTNLDKLKDKFLAMPPGTRIVLNTFSVTGWTPDDTAHLSGCDEWCEAMLFIVPARVEGRWRLGNATLTLTQEFQMVSGTIDAVGSVSAVTAGRLRGDAITFTAAGRTYSGRLVGDRLEGPGWVATRLR